ncbi:MAG: hypothetical protein GY795_39255 [Desulfobacterales bacterium]|nr:hypothetical protein [Desulfobacterales bacterium]
MSHTYHLICVDCATVLDLGKIANIDEDGKTVTWQFAGWKDQENAEWIKGKELWTLVEKFLILHRGHILTVISESFLLDKSDPEGNLTYIDSGIQLVDQPVNPEPDDYEDAEKISPIILEKIKGKV